MLIENINILAITAVLSIIAHSIGWIQGLFSPLKKFLFFPIPLFIGIGIFIVVLTLYALLPSFFFHSLTHGKWIPTFLQNVFFASFLSMFIITVFLVIVILLIEKEKIELAYWKDDCKIAIYIYLILLPTIGFISHALTLINIGLFHSAGEEQLAVTYLKKALSSPFHCLWMTLSVCFFAPIIEEILFRGLLHQMLRTVLPFFSASTISSLFFSLVHFSPSQGIGNIPLLGSLFVLSYYLAYIYEKKQRLTASIILHIIFNLISTIRIISL
ncbi:MAG: CPBP family intramembrane metalloprotease [Chlamydiales bacterium]|nr:CPBP family intramembrane metalloprotease [Chlamydiales bacterium]